MRIGEKFANFDAFGKLIANEKVPYKERYSEEISSSMRHQRKRTQLTAKQNEANY